MQSCVLNVCLGIVKCTNGSYTFAFVCVLQPPPLPRQTHSAYEPMGRLDVSGLEALKVLIKSKAPNIIAEYEKSGTISTKNRMLLVRFAVSNLVERRGL